MKNQAKGQKRGYHHGNLRQALIEATLVLVVDKGPFGFTLTEAARRAGVSPAAVYRHFTGREELIEAAAEQGFVIFADLMESAHETGQPNPLAAFEATGRAYLAFAREFPGHYICMFEAGVALTKNTELKAAADRGFGVLTRAAEDLFEHMPAEKRPPARMVSHHVWALSHGVVEHFARGAPGTKSPFAAEDLLETGVGIYLRGLGIIPPDQP